MTFPRALFSVPPAPLLLFLCAVPLACGGSDSDDGGGPDSGALDGAVEAGEVPTAPAPMFEFLVAGDYLDYEAESSVHRSAGPHGAGGVRSFINPLLAASLVAGDGEHPVGAAAIKELYASGGTTVSGWAAAVKVSAGSGGGTWYWYEVFSTTNGSNPIEGNGNTTCTGCHAAGSDFIRLTFPLI